MAWGPTPTPRGSTRGARSPGRGRPCRRRRWRRRFHTHRFANL